MTRLAALLVLAALWLWPPHRAVAATTTDYCAYGHQTTLLLVDRTTRFDATDRSIFLDALNGVVERLGAGDRLVMFTMTAAYTESRKVFESCKPACPDENFFAELLATCRPVLARSDYRGFVDTLAHQLADLLRNPEETPYSDLFRTVAETTRAETVGSQQKLGTVILLSDLLENSQFLPEREFRAEPVAQTLRRLQAADIRPSVAGAAIRVFGFGRDDSPARIALPQDQRRRVAEVWTSWFRAAGAASVEIGFR